MHKLLQILFIILLVIGAVSCSKDDDDLIPQNQDIVTSDSTLVTGELTVVAKYYKNSNLSAAPNGTSVKLFATYEDMQNDLDIYDLFTNDGGVYFGFINHGTYYVKSEVTVNGVSYSSENAVQVRPNRLETLTITMFPN